jgi:Uma2 family endonuclease
MVFETKPVTITEFEQFIRRKENADRPFELIGGKIIEVVSNPFSSKTAARFITFLGMYLLNHDIGHLTSSDGGYTVSGERYIPDVGFIRYEKQPELTYDEGYNPNPPDLAIEVLSPLNNLADIHIKIGNYLRAGTTVWVADPPKKQVTVYAPGQEERTVGIDGKLDGGDVLPGFTLAVRDVFPD